jgi:hypothetical protein
MANNFKKGTYSVLNPNKYTGRGAPTYRSGWELTFMRFCDNNPNIISWASEAVRIPYKNPFTGKQTTYVPDFLITYMGKNNQRRAELIEVKPRAQVTLEVARSTKEKASVILNMAKWEAARAWCKGMGCQFRIITEEDLFNKASPNRTRRK